jgi:hypothetical protein
MAMRSRASQFYMDEPGSYPLICSVVGVAQDPSGGARRDRTDDLMLAKHALSQLSYGPKRDYRAAGAATKMVGLGRLELPTSRLSSARSNQLSYKPETVVPKSCDDFRSDRARVPTRKIFCARSRGAGSSMKEREKKTAVSCQWT